ncbi:MAG: metallophosphoesterase [Muribaculaceae bacterium]|nr:metallophosphoesterase [Muribaculaceae bacterium]
MRLPLLLIVPVIIICILVDYVIRHRLIHSRLRYPWAYIHTGVSVSLVGLLIGILFIPLKDSGGDVIECLMWFLYSYLTIYVPKLAYCIFYGISELVFKIKHRRVKALEVTGIFVAAGIFILLWSGVFNRNNIIVKAVNLTYKDLPKGLDGLSIVQISDLHVGTWGNDTVFVSRLVGHINDLNPDIIVFTGDIVNRESSELEPFIAPLGRLKARYGVYSIMGNHDYGDYKEWSSDSSKQADVQRLKDMQEAMGWHMLNNTHRLIEINNDTLCLIGVENIGDPPFHTYGDLGKAYPTLGDKRFKILLSHNPAHWHKDLRGQQDKNISLTLSGHTHAMQIKILGWSPAAYRYDEWSGLYHDGYGHDLYVNDGCGTVGIPARIGATPEITLFKLSRQ